MNTNRRTFRLGLIGTLAAAAALAGISAGAAPAPPARTATASEAAPAEHSLSDLAFLAGRWQSRDAENGLAEEHWSAPEGSSIMGMFRWVTPDGRAMMFEILTITQEPEGIILRLRHFSPTLAAKEAKDKPMALKLSKLEGRRAVFTAHKDSGGLAEVVYECATPDALAITVAFEDGSRPPLEFAMTREGAGK